MCMRRSVGFSLATGKSMMWFLNAFGVLGLLIYALLCAPLVLDIFYVVANLAVSLSVWLWSVFLVMRVSVRIGDAAGWVTWHQTLAHLFHCHRHKSNLDQVETSYSRHLVEEELLPSISRTPSARIQNVFPKVTTRNQPLSTRNQQACSKPKQYRREAHQDCARKHVRCIAL